MNGDRRCGSRSSKSTKPNGPPMPEGMSAQIPYIHRAVEALNIPAVKQAGYEADDLIGTLAQQGGARRR